MKISISFLAAVLASGFLPLAAQAQGDSPSAAAVPSDLSQCKSADELWFYIQDLKKGPKTKPASQEEAQAGVANMISQIHAATAEFLTQYPDDPRKWDAQLLQVETAGAMSRLSGQRDDGSTAAQLRDLAGQPEAPASVRGDARHELLVMSLRAYMSGDKSITPDSILAGVNQFAADFPAYPSIDILKYQIARALSASAPAAAGTLLNELAASGQGKIADQARKELATAEKLKSPLDLHFTAVDGTDVDISRMRGKVVLIDFWATWCGPCRAELPHVLDAYKNLHDKGFEVVGISLDQSRDSLVKFTASNGMVWPQYFDGKGWQNGISSSFGIESIPTMWLVNKKGYVVDTNGRADLEGQVEKLLAE